MPSWIQREAIESSSIAEIGYDPTRQILLIAFKTGEVFHYGSVPLEKVVEFYAAESRGRYYSQQIKGKFPGAKMTGHCTTCQALGWVGDPCACGEGVYMDDRQQQERATA